jgi:hypothetical protein
MYLVRATTKVGEPLWSLSTERIRSLVTILILAILLQSAPMKLLAMVSEHTCSSVGLSDSIALYVRVILADLLGLLRLPTEVSPPLDLGEEMEPFASFGEILEFMSPPPIRDS